MKWSNFMLSIAFLSPDNGGTEGGAKTIEAIFNAVKSADKRVDGARVVWAGKACFHKNKQTRYMKEPQARHSIFS